MTLHIEVTGRGPALVLIHGWALHGGVFAPLVERLADRCTLYCVDLPGHGQSRDPHPSLQLDACARELLAQVPAAIWLGWSLGGLFALRAALLSDQVQGVALIAATPRFVRAHDWPHAVESSVFHQFGQDLQRDFRGTLERFLALDTIGSSHAREELRSLKQTLYARGEPDAEALQQGLHLLETCDLRADLADLRVPSLWISGQRDRLVSPAGMRDAAALAPWSHHLDIRGGGHAPFLGHADEVARELLEFVRTLHPEVAPLSP
ncbi:carboxylesterase BioH (pimeloyl-CoA synthesis) [Pseudoxanthomonas indica]|uniref:Pimeloyl-[acyl-carrier protein] methyl ester esterase n=1 Tax=Pseudoxanthomonas indica TaxID=428993 RepID=A0A1T5KRS9_9GAMM|nr:pimeloyl-[acyl-carrier protein] methyl ester esterase [Pseudoxanthomonas indica]SKC66215.1 carboxylesterase BioH (pimeloyl-CoA synthesis) [Pseudoxanthomonas indica]